MAKEIPVYLFVGFLESGKTKFIQETFEDPNFDSGDKTLLLICEEGEEEYNEKKFAFPGVTVKVLEDKSELNPQNLAKLGKKNGCLIEGMACPGGCIAGAGTNVAILQAQKALSSFQNEAERKLPPQNAMDEAK